MKRLKYVTLLFAMLFVLFVPTMKVNAATRPATPKNVKLYDQAQSKMTIMWNLDKTLPNDYKYGKIKGWGYEVIVLDIKGNKIQFNNASKVKILSSDTTKCVTEINNERYNTEQIIVKVRSYYISKDNKKVSSLCASKKIVPRAKIYSTSVTGSKNNKIKLNWKKVIGAKSYTVFMSGNGGKTFVEVGTTSNLNLTTPALTAGKTYVVYVRVNGRNSNVFSTPIEYKSGKVLNAYKIKISYR